MGIKMGVVYWLYNKTCKTPSRDGYVGACTNIEQRIREHRSRKFPSRNRIPKNFKWKILYTGSFQKCLKLEAKLRPEPLIGWNVYSGQLAGAKRPPETGQKLSAILTGRSLSPAHKRAISAGHTGMRYSRAHRQAISAGLTGRQHSLATRKKQRRSANKRYRKNPKIAKMISITLTGRSLSLTHRQAISAGLTGRHHSIATRKKQRRSATRRYCKPSEHRKTGKAVRQALKDDPSIADRISASLMGHTSSPKTNAKISASLMGHKRTMASRRKQSRSTKGKPKSAAWIAKMKKIAKERYRDQAERDKTSRAVKRGLANR